MSDLERKRIPDPEEVVRVIAQLRYAHPHGLLSKVCDLIVMRDLRYAGEGYEQYQTRMHGPLEPLP